MRLVDLEKFEIKKGLEKREKQALRQTRFFQVGLKGGGRGILLGGNLDHSMLLSVNIDQSKLA